MSESNETKTGATGAMNPGKEKLWITVEVIHGIVEAVNVYRRRPDAVEGVRNAMDGYDDGDAGKRFEGASGNDPRRTEDWSGESWSSDDGDADLYLWSTGVLAAKLSVPVAARRGPRCPYCRCELQTDERGGFVGHDHIDDSVETLERPWADY